MEKIIPLGHLKALLVFAVTLIVLNSSTEALTAYFSRPSPPITVVEKVECRHLINGTEIFPFHGKVIFQTPFEAHDYQVMKDRPTWKFNAVFLKSDKGEYLLMYTHLKPDSSLEGLEIQGWFANQPRETLSGFTKEITQGVVPDNEYPVSYPIMVETITPEPEYKVN